MAGEAPGRCVDLADPRKSGEGSTTAHRRGGRPCSESGSQMAVSWLRGSIAEERVGRADKRDTGTRQLSELSR
jgi:hypothetical protein